MLLYGLGVSPIAKRLREAFPTLVQPWYADDGAMVGPSSTIGAAMDLLKAIGPSRGYYPQPEKSILICKPADRQRCQQILGHHGFTFTDGHRYLGGFVGTRESMLEWLRPKIQRWKEDIETLAAVAHRYPQAAYAGLTRSLQNEWQYLQLITTSPWGE